MFNLLKIRENTSDLLPKKKIKSHSYQENKFKTLLFKFLCGADCIDDLDWLREDTIFKTITDGALLQQLLVSFLDHLIIDLLNSFKKL